MKARTLLFIGLFCGHIGLSQTLNPEVYSTSGDYFTNLNNTLSWTLGECVIETYTGSNNILTQGFQQSSYLINSVEENISDNFSICLYPNPSNGLITISCERENSRKMEVELFDINGRLVCSERFQNHFQLTLLGYSSDEFIIRVRDDNNKVVKTFKVINTN